MEKYALAFKMLVKRAREAKGALKDLAEVIERKGFDVKAWSFDGKTLEIAGCEPGVLKCEAKGTEFVVMISFYDETPNNEALGDSLKTMWRKNPNQEVSRNELIKKVFEEMAKRLK